MSGVHFHSFNTRCRELISQTKEYTSTSRLHHDYKQLLIYLLEEYDLQLDVISVQEIIGALCGSKSVEKDLFFLLQSSLWYQYALQHNIIGEKDDNMAILYSTNKLLDETVGIACSIPTQAMDIARGTSGEMDLNLSVLDNTQDQSHVHMSEQPTSFDQISDPCCIQQLLPVYSSGIVRDSCLASLHPVYKRLLQEDLTLLQSLIQTIQAYMQLQLENNNIVIHSSIVHVYGVQIGILEYKLLIKKNIKWEQNVSPLVEYSSILYIGMNDTHRESSISMYLPIYAYYQNLGSLLLSVGDPLVEKHLMDLAVHSCNLHTMVIMEEEWTDQLPMASFLSLLLLICMLPGEAMGAFSQAKLFMHALITQTQIFSCLVYLPSQKYTFLETIEMKIGELQTEKLQKFTNPVLLASNIVKLNTLVYKDFSVAVTEYKTLVDKYIDGLWMKKSRFLLKVFNERCKRISKEMKHIQSTLYNILPQMNKQYEDERNSSMAQMQENSEVQTILHNSSFIQNQKLTQLQLDQHSMETNSTALQAEHVKQSLCKENLESQLSKKDVEMEELSDKYKMMCERNVEQQKEVQQGIVDTAHVVELETQVKAGAEQKEQLQIVKETVQTLQTDNIGLKQQVHSIEEAYIALKQKNHTTEKTVRTLEDEQKGANETLKEKQALYSFQESKVGTLKDTLTEKEGELVEWKRKDQMRQVDYTVQQDKKHTLELELVKVKEKNASLLALVSAGSGQIRALETTMTQAKLEQQETMQTTQKKHQNLVSKLKTQQEDHAKVLQDRQTEYDSLAVKDKQIHSQKQQLKTVQSEKQGYLLTIQTSKEETVSAVKAHEDSLASTTRLQKVVNLQKQDLNGKKGQIDALQATVDKYQTIANMFSGVQRS